MQLCKRSLFVHELVKMVNELDATRALAAVRSLISLGLSCLCAKYVYLLQVQKFTKSHSRSAFCTRSIHHWCLSSYIDFVWSGHVTGVATWSQLNAYNKWTVNQMAVWSPGSVWVHCNKNLTLYNPKFLLHSCKHIWLLFSMNTFLK